MLLPSSSLAAAAAMRTSRGGLAPGLREHPGVWGEALIVDLGGLGSEF